VEDREDGNPPGQDSRPPDGRILRFHPLKADRAGQYAISLARRARLIVTFTDRTMTVVRIEEVSVEHYGD
jgi:plasmid maintenance system killer protein